VDTPAAQCKTAARATRSIRLQSSPGWQKRREMLWLYREHHTTGYLHISHGTADDGRGTDRIFRATDRRSRCAVPLGHSGASEGSHAGAGGPGDREAAGCRCVTSKMPSKTTTAGCLLSRGGLGLCDRRPPRAAALDERSALVTSDGARCLAHRMRNWRARCRSICEGRDRQDRCGRSRQARAAGFCRSYGPQMTKANDCFVVELHSVRRSCGI
jgi:hypothetical protein